MGGDTYYDILGLSPTASLAEIKAKYRALIRRIHPDLDGPAALFRQVQQAYEVLSDPGRRATYDLSLTAGGRATRPSPDNARTGAYRRAGPHQEAHNRRDSGAPRGQSGATRSSGYVPRVKGRNAGEVATSPSFFGQHPARAVAVGGAALLVVGTALDDAGRAVVVLGAVVLIIAAIAGLGGRGAREREAYQRSGMAAVDAMTGRQFQVLLEHFFANKGYRVARLSARQDFGSGLLLDDTHGRTLVQVRRWTGVVGHDTVQQAAIAKAHYGAVRALVVTSSNYSQHALTVANSNGVTLWDRSTVEAELCGFRGRSGVKKFSSDLRAGSRICLGFVAALFVVQVVAHANARRRRRPAKRRDG